MLSLHRLEEFLQAVPAFGSTGLHAGLEHAVTIFDRVEEGMRGQFRPAAAEVLKRERLDRYMAGHALPFERPDDALGRDDFAVFPAETVLLDPVGSPVDEAVIAAGPEVYLTDCERVISRAPPPVQVLTLAVMRIDMLPYLSYWLKSHPINKN